jgi:8-oxo-dGTP pyrophosphatase MutT (NUDIX family)
MTQESKKLIYRAGVIPYHIDENGTPSMLFMKPSHPDYGGDQFQMAKGKVDPGENSEQAALREGQEELGLFSGNVEKLHNLGNFLGRTQVYVAEIKNKTMFGDPHFETEETKWMTLPEFLEIGRPLHKPLVKAAHRWILEQINK